MEEAKKETKINSTSLVVLIVLVIIVVIARQNNKMDSTTGESQDVMEQNSSMEKESDEQIIINIDGKNFEFSESEIRVKEGDKVKIVFTSTEGIHDWTIDEFNAKTKAVSEGVTTEVEFVASQKGTFEYYCSVGNHRSLGMKGNLIVE